MSFDKRRTTVALVLAFLLIGILACTPLTIDSTTEEGVTPVVIGGGEQTEEPPVVVETEPPPPPPPGGNVLENPAGGFDLIYPSDWVASDPIGGTIILAENAAVLETAEGAFPLGAAMGILYGTPGQMIEFEGTGDSAEDLLLTMLDDMVASGSDVGPTEQVRFAAETGVGARFTITEDDQTFAGYAATYLSDVHGLVLIAVAPEDRWDETWPTFSAIIGSVIFYPPAGPAALGEPLPIDYGDTVEGFLTEPGEMQPWEFFALEGDVVTISMVGLSDDFDDTYLELYGPDGTLVTDDDDGGEGWFALIEDYELPETGYYIIVARAYSIDTGPYELSLTLAGESQQEQGGDEQDREIEYGETHLAELTDDENRHYYTFEGTAGDVVTISAEGLWDFDDTFLELWGPSGGMLTDDDDSGDGWFALIEDFTLPETGTYEIMVRGFAGAVGAYELTLTGP